MKYAVFSLTLFTVIGLFFIFSGQPSFEPENEKFPDDWFFRQRAFPYNTINQDVYIAEMKKAKKQREEFHDKASIWDFKGPTNIEGRITDVELKPGNSQVIYIGAASGGVFKSENSGTSWIPVFDDAESLSIGDIAISRSNPDIIYVGTGEANAGGGSLTYDGLGVYKSTDGAQTWQFAGLENSGSIGRMAIHPDNPDIVYVAAMGRLFSDGGQGGIFKTTDGGQTWQQKLFVSDSTGAIDVVINPEHPDTVYAAMWERIRRPNRRSYGGATSGIYRSTDGGDTWTELTNGLPGQAEQKGRIGIDLCQNDPEILYAVYADQTGYFQGIYRSANNGDSWVKKDNGIDDNAYASYGWWFGRIKADPVNPDIAYLIGFYLYKTSSGGNNWFQATGWGVHVDQHGLAINPNNNSMLFLGNDGGFYKSTDGGSNWARNASLPITQFYTCEVDEQHPYRIYGGAQDNGTNRTMTGSLNDWEEILGGDGLTVIVDPTDNSYVYAQFQYGLLRRSTSGGNGFITAMSGILASDRFNWHCPVILDPTNPSVLYYGTNRLYRSTDRAASWTPVSEDLTNGEEPGNLAYNTLTTIAVSPMNNKIVYTGSDDGNVYYSGDSCETWTNISGSLPERWVTSVVADPFDENRVYVTFSGYRWDDYLPHVFRSDNHGQSWEDISSELPEVPVNELIVDPQDSGYLYLATDAGVYFSENNGETWSPAGSGMPLLVIDDLRLHNPSRKLFAATYGRGIYALDLDILTGIKNRKENKSFEVSCYPNPFKEKININVQGTGTGISVMITDMQGRKITTLFNGTLNGTGEFSWDGSGQPAGVYLVNIIAEKGRTTRKIVLN
jgi:photosystem II stability/assembly factor-like uncharacterized protein